MININHSQKLVLPGFLIIGITLALFVCVNAFADGDSDNSTTPDLPGSTRPIAPDMHKQFATDLLTGSAVFNLPITLPKGRQGIQPNVSLAYSSTDGNSWCGVGWDLNLGCIQRNTKKGPPKYNNTDTFISSVNSSNSELVYTGGKEYRAKIESQFLRFSYNTEDDFWEVTDKNGCKYFFGSDTSSRVNNIKGTFKWCLDKVLDVHGNYMTITYIKDQGQLYPKGIAYTGNKDTGEMPKRSVEFLLEDRADIVSACRSGAKIYTAKRLHHIEVKINGVRTRKYVFNYTQSPETNRSLLTSVTQYGRDGTSALPPITFSYQSGSKIILPEESPQGGAGNNIWNIRWSRGNSFPAGDMILYSENIPNKSGGETNPHLADGTKLNFWETTHTEAAGTTNGGSWSSNQENGEFQCQSAQGNAFWAWTYIYVSERTTLDLFLSPETNPTCFLNDKFVEPRYNPHLELNKGFNLVEITGYSQSGGTTGENFILSGAPAEIVEVITSKRVMFSSPSGDFNGDGLTDIGSFDNQTGKWEVSLSQGEDFASSAQWWLYSNPTTHCMSAGGDFNGDGRTDAGVYNGNSYAKFAFSDGSGFKNDFTFTCAELSDHWYEISFTGDFNGDGLTDIGFGGNHSPGWTVFFSDGKYFSATPNIVTTATGFNLTRTALIIGDFNGDGMADFGSFDSWEGNWRVSLSRGESNHNEFDLWLSDFGEREQLPMAADFNQDGLTDIGFLDKENGQWEIALSTGTKFVPAGIWIDNFGKGTWAPQCADYNGDGLIDTGIFNTTSVTGNRKIIAYGQGKVPDSLSCVSNGLGGSISITYKPSTQLENTFLPFPAQVVSSVTRNDGLGNKYTTNYTYSQGLYDAQDREFRGFGYVRAQDAEQTVTETWFHQDDIFKGKMSKQRISSAGGNIFQEILSNWQKKCPYPGYEQICFAYLFSSEQRDYDGQTGNAGQTACKQTRTEFAYDNYGNVTRAIAYGEVEGAQDTQNDKRVTNTEYTYNKEKWILNKPARTYTQNYQGNKVSENWFYYDGHSGAQDAPAQGALTKQEQWLNTGGAGSSGGNPVTTMEYDSYGNCICSTDARGNKTTTTYEPQYHTYPENITNAAGHSETFSYDASFGNLLSSTDANGNTTRNVYDQFGRLSKVYGPGDSEAYPRLKYEYDLSSVPIKVITYSLENKNSGSARVSYTFYDGLGRAVQQKYPAEESGKYIAADTVIYNSRGKVKKQYLPYYTTSSSTYTPPGASAPCARSEYDALGRETLLIHPDGTSIGTVYTRWQKEVTDENGSRTRHSYDAFGNLVKVEEFNGSARYVTVYTYDAQNNLVSITDAQNNTTTITYDSLSRKTAMNDMDMGQWKYAYDAAGNMVKQTDANGQAITFVYDSLNRITGKTSSINQTRDIYDSTAKPNCLGRLSKVSDSSGSTEYFYDEEGREVKTVQDIGGVIFTTEHAYDLLGRVTAVTYPDGEKVTYTYNTQGLPEKVSGNAVYVSGITYNACGQMIYIQYGNGTHTDYQYNPQTLRLSSLKTNGSGTLTTSDGSLQDLSYQFDKTGNISKISDSVNTATQSFKYDNLNRLTEAAGSYGTTAYTYDAIGNMLKQGNVTYAYGEGAAGPHAITGITDATKTTKISYDANGNMTASGETIYRYDAENRLIEVKGPVSSGTAQVNLNFSAGWNFVSIPVIPDSWDIAAILAGLKYQTDYDHLARYSSAQSGTNGKFEYYVNTPEFNQFSALEYGRGYQLYVTNPAGVKLTISGKVPGSSGIALSKGWNLIAAPTTAEITVAAALNNLKLNTDYTKIVKYNTSTKSFTQLSSTDKLKAGESYFIYMLRTATWTLPTQYVTTAFTYDANGNRIKKVSGGSTTIYAGSLYEIENSACTKYVFLGQTRICSIGDALAENMTASTLKGSFSAASLRKKVFSSSSLSIQGDSSSSSAQEASAASSEAISYYHPDHLGSTNLITDGAGKQKQLIEYTPFGEISKQSGADFTSYKFTGKELDDASGLYYYGARYYNPALCHFTQADPIIQNTADPQTLNHYAYCRNNPLIYVDPTGMSWDSWGWSNMWSDFTYSMQQNWNIFTNSLQNTLNQTATFGMNQLEKIGQETQIFGQALGMGIEYGTKYWGEKVLNSQLPGQWWPNWTELFVPGYETYGGPMRSDPTFTLKPKDSMDNLFREHDIAWSKGYGREADVTLLQGLYTLPSNLQDWDNPPEHFFKAICYRKCIAEPFFWWVNFTRN